MIFTTLFFDLDDTIYPNTNGLWPAIRDRMGEYMAERLGLPRDQIPGLRRTYYETYGTTLRGLQAHHQVDADDYLEYVHNLPLEHYLTPDPGLRALLLGLPQPKWIFTNADAGHARRVLAASNLSDCFNGIIDVRATNFACKPEQQAYQGALVLAAERNPTRCVLFDDSPQPGFSTLPDFFTVLVGTRETNPAADRSVASLQELPQALPELWLNDNLR
jgi:putative hydrolase of the HAD superfamily